MPDKVTMERAAIRCAEEPRFGFWFLQSGVFQHTSRVSMADPHKLVRELLSDQFVCLDADYGQSKSFLWLQQSFAPTPLLGLEDDLQSQESAQVVAELQVSAVQPIARDCAAIQRAWAFGQRRETRAYTAPRNPRGVYCG